MTNNDLYLIKASISNVKDNGNNQYKMLLILNEMKIDERLKVLEQLVQPTEKYQEYVQKARELANEHGEQENGNLVVYTLPNGQGEKTTGNGYPHIIKDKEAYDEKYKALEKQYSKAIEEHKKKATDFNKTLFEDVSPVIAFDKIPFSIVPEMSYSDLRALMPIIEP